MIKALDAMPLQPERARQTPEVRGGLENCHLMSSFREIVAGSQA